MRLSNTRRTAVAAGMSLALITGLTVPAEAAPNLPAKLARAVTIDNVNRHLIALQRIADTNAGNRAAGTPGHDASVGYVAGLLRASGFLVTTPEFTFDRETIDVQTLTVGGQDVVNIPFAFSPSGPEGGLTGPLVVAIGDGCEAEDYPDGAAGAIALIQRGACTFTQKQSVAADAGALGVVIYNNVEGDLNGTLGDLDSGRVPTTAITQAAGEALVASAGAETTLDLQITREEVTTRNVVAQTRSGRTDNVVMAGSHLDSVEEGPGINDNGSGSAALLETALRLGSSPKVKNAVRFAWWSAEELGLLGAEDYVANLDFESRLDIAMYLNFDMIGSPNAAYFVYDGDDSDVEGAGPGPFGSAQIEKAFVDALGRQNVPTQGTDFDGRSDYGPFIAQGIPSGGLFTGAEDVKTKAQARLWGGKANVAFDACYHQACDNLGNVDRVALDRNSNALATVIAQYALSTQSVNGVSPRKTRAAERATERTLKSEMPMAGVA
ncbi:MAG: M28 family metallopeptidase [Mycobacteriaceae bacterium]